MDGALYLNHRPFVLDVSLMMAILYLFSLMATGRYTRSLLPMLRTGCILYSTILGPSFVYHHQHAFLTISGHLDVAVFPQKLDINHDRLHWDRDNASLGHQHSRTLSHTKSNKHTCLAGMPGPNSADLEPMLAKVSPRFEQSIAAYPETEKISCLFDRFCRKGLLCCLVHPRVAVQRVVVVFTTNGLQRVCTYLIAQAGRFVTSPGGYRRDVLCIL